MGALRSRWPLILVAVLLAVLIGGAVAVYAYDRSRADILAPGVRIGGVEVGGMTTEAASARLHRALVTPVARPIVVRAGDRTFRLSARRAGVSVDVRGAVDRALARSRQGSIVTRTVHAIGGARVEADFRPRTVYRHAAVRRLVARASRAVRRAPRDAHVSFAADTVATTPSHAGRALRAGRLTRRIRAAIVTPGAPRRFRAHTRRVAPKVSTGELASKYAAVMTLDRSSFTLRLFRHLKLARSYTVAVGQAGLNTPAGLYHIQSKQVNPTWYVPNSAWAGDLAGKTIPPGPDDPLKARFMGIFAGSGIHGVDPSEYGTLGHAASHGCVRMRIPDVVQLYDQVSVGTPIYIAG